MLLDESIECSLKNAINPRQARSRRDIPALRKPPNELDPRLVRDVERELQSGASERGMSSAHYHQLKRDTRSLITLRTSMSPIVWLVEPLEERSACNGDGTSGSTMSDSWKLPAELGDCENTCIFTRRLSRLDIRGDGGVGGESGRSGLPSVITGSCGGTSNQGSSRVDALSSDLKKLGSGGLQ